MLVSFTGFHFYYSSSKVSFTTQDESALCVLAVTLVLTIYDQRQVQLELELTRVRTVLPLCVILLPLNTWMSTNEGPDERTHESAFTLLVCKMRPMGSSDEMVPPRCSRL